MTARATTHGCVRRIARSIVQRGIGRTIYDLLCDSFAAAIGRVYFDVLK